MDYNEKTKEELIEEVKNLKHQLEQAVEEQKKREKDLFDIEQRYTSIFDNIGIGVALISPDMEILSLNRKMQEWFPHIDLTKKHICYRSFNKPPKDDVCSYCPTIKTLKDGKTHQGVTSTPAMDKTIHYRVVSSAIKDERGKVVAAIEMVEDVTARNIIEQELKKHVYEMESVFRSSAAKDGRIIELEEQVKSLQKQLGQHGNS